MASILEEVGWGKPALSLLSQCMRLDPELPAVMHIRHTERPPSTLETTERARETGRSALLSTEKGKQAAFEFGQRLPSDRVYRVYHSPVDRAVETAEQIFKALQAAGRDVQPKGVFLKQYDDFDRRLDYFKKDAFEGEVADTLQFFINRLSERYPPWELESYALVARRHAAIVTENLKTAVPQSLDVYVSHDTYVAAFMFYWFSMMPREEFIEFLDGFVLQLQDDRMIVYTKDERKEVGYPYWWRF